MLRSFPGLPFPGLLGTGVLLLGALLPGQDAGCRSCNGTGTRPCSGHRKLLELEQAVSACSEAVRCRHCGGVLERDCQSCANPVAEADLKKRAEELATWLDGRRKSIDAVTGGKEILHLRTAHVDLAFSVRPLTVGRTKLDTHRLMHLYGERIEELRALFLSTFGCDDRALPARLQVFLFKDLLDHQRLAPRVTGQGSGSNGTKLMGIDSVYCAFHNPQTMPGDEELHRNVVHNVTHLLLANATPTRWLGNRKAGWIDAGVAHWFEDKVTGKCTNFCYEEVALHPGAGFKGGRWRVPLRKMAEAGEIGTFARLSQLNTDELTFQDHAHAFACIDYLMTTQGGPKLKGMIDRVKQDLAVRDAMKEVLATNVLAFDGELIAWIKATYPMEEGNR
ncbi:MAG: hypothetical protein R3F56_02435 [Planctomycetota bacterium]